MFSPRIFIIKILEKFDKSDAYADILLNNEFRQQQIQARDKALIQEIFYGVVRWRNRIDWVIDQLFKGSVSKSPRFIKYILETGIYQIMFMDKIPVHAVINEAVNIAKSKGGKFWAGKINAILRTCVREKQNIAWPDIEKNPAEYISIFYSHPHWLIERWIEQFGIDDTIALCKTNNQIPDISIRTNILKNSSAELRDRLDKIQIQTTTSDDNPDFLKTNKLPDISNLEPFQEGFFTIQDESAGYACKLLSPKPGDTILDLCAAPGGKTTYIAELLNDQGKIIALDRNFSRLNLLKQNINRLGINSVSVVQADANQFSSQIVDKIIIDAPCSGLGVLSKRVDLRWKRTWEQIKSLKQTQKNLLENASQLVKPGGAIVYCTCTIEPEENEFIIQEFLREHEQFKIDHAQNYVPHKFTNDHGYIKTFPHRHGMDGSFAVRLIKL